MAKAKKNSFVLKVIISIIIISISIGVYTTVNILLKIYQPNVIISSNKNTYLYIPTGSNIQYVCKTLYENNYVVNRSSFEWLAKRMNYSNHIKPGRYKLYNRMNNKQLIELLRSGQQEPIKLSFNSVRTTQQLAGVVSRQIEADSTELLNLVISQGYMQQYGFNENTGIANFIPNTYEMYWNTNAQLFIKRMNKEYVKFWTDKRLQKAKKLGLLPVQVITLASIVDEESYMPAEYPVIAGVYLNRLKKGMPLQADPTVKFALNNFSIKRILLKHLHINSPYNTYKNKGLPPGPIAVPSIKAIDGVLNAQNHSYLYFCAKADFSGYHAYAKNLVQHNQNAKDYQRQLNKRHIR